MDIIEKTAGERLEFLERELKRDQAVLAEVKRVMRVAKRQLEFWEERVRTKVDLIESINQEQFDFFERADAK